MMPRELTEPAETNDWLRSELDATLTVFCVL